MAVAPVDDRLLARGKSKISFLGAVMQKLVHLFSGVFKTHQQYQQDHLKNAYLMVEATQQAGEPVRRISFKGSVQAVNPEQ